MHRTSLRRRLGGLAIAATLGTAGLMAVPASAEETFSAEQTRQIERIVRELLLKNPEIILDAVDEYKRRQELAANEAAKKALEENKAEIFSSPDDPVGGNPDGNVALVEFFDYQCGYCKAVVNRVVDVVDGDKNVRWVFKEFPILGPVSVYAAKAALAANLQDDAKYHALHLAMMRNRGKLSEKKVLAFAQAAGLDIERLKTDMGGAEVGQIIKRNLALAKSLNIRGTPSFIVGDQVIRGAVDGRTLVKLIRDARSG